jgi:hypothetical protein
VRTTASSSADACAEKDDFRWRPFALASLVALVCAGLSVQTLLGAGYDRNPKIRAVRAKADSFVSAASRTQNFGRQRDLEVDASPQTRAYLSFEVDLSSSEIQHVSVLLYSQTQSRIGYQVRLVNGSWRERRITYENAPRVSSEFVASGPLRAHSWKAVDVTSLVLGDSNGASFALTTVSSNGAAFASRETGLHGPRLVVESQPNDTTTTTGGEMPPQPR